MDANIKKNLGDALREAGLILSIGATAWTSVQTSLATWTNYTLIILGLVMTALGKFFSVLYAVKPNDVITLKEQVNSKQEGQNENTK